MSLKSRKFILWFKEISHKDVPLVGGKNASLGEMYNQLTRKGINLVNGFALTTQAYWKFFEENNLGNKLRELLKDLNPNNISDLAQKGKKARQLILKSDFPKELKQEILKAYKELSQYYKTKNLEVAVRSSGVAEDAPTDSFAGQFETYLNVKGEKELLLNIKRVAFKY